MVRADFAWLKVSTTTTHLAAFRILHYSARGYLCWGNGWQLFGDSTLKVRFWGLSKHLVPSSLPSLSSRTCALILSPAFFSYHLLFARRLVLGSFHAPAANSSPLPPLLPCSSPLPAGAVLGAVQAPGALWGYLCGVISTPSPSPLSSPLTPPHPCRCGSGGRPCTWCRVVLRPPLFLHLYSSSGPISSPLALKVRFWGSSMHLVPCGVISVVFDDDGEGGKEKKARGGDGGEEEEGARDTVVEERDEEEESKKSNSGNKESFPKSLGVGGGGEQYEWSKVTTGIYNIIVGKLQVEHFGTMHIRGSRGLSVSLHFKEPSLFDRSKHQVSWGELRAVGMRSQVFERSFCASMQHTLSGAVGVFALQEALSLRPQQVPDAIGAGEGGHGARKSAALGRAYLGEGSSGPDVSSEARQKSAAVGRPYLGEVSVGPDVGGSGLDETNRGDGCERDALTPVAAPPENPPEMTPVLPPVHPPEHQPENPRQRPHGPPPEKPPEHTPRHFADRPATRSAPHSLWHKAASATAHHQQQQQQQQQEEEQHGNNKYNFSPFCVTLNEITPDIAPFLPPTDSRFRPDQRALEEGDEAWANEEKRRLEGKQRKVGERVKRLGGNAVQMDMEEWEKVCYNTVSQCALAINPNRESTGNSSKLASSALLSWQARQVQASGWEPRWFQQGAPGGTWTYKGGYWERRSSRDWGDIPHIFAADESSSAGASGATDAAPVATPTSSGAPPAAPAAATTPAPANPPRPDAAGAAALGASGGASGGASIFCCWCCYSCPPAPPPAPPGSPPASPPAPPPAAVAAAADPVARLNSDGWCPAVMAGVLQ
ncbi:unnamed protein product [Closterium sp. NIES-53]